MSRWQENFDSRIFRQEAFQEFVKELADFNLPEEVEVTPELVGELSRIKKAVKYIQENLSLIDPELVNEGVMTDVDNQLNNIMNCFNNFKSNHSIGELQTANSHIDPILNKIPLLFVFYNKISEANLANIIRAYEDKTTSLTGDQEKKFETLKEKKDELAKEYSEIEESFNQVKGEIESKLEEISNSFNEKQKERQDSFNEKQKERQDSFNEKQKERQDSFNQKQQERDGAFTAFSENVNQKSDEEFAALSSKALATLQILEKIKKDAEEVFGVVQGTIQAGSHKQEADKQRKKANFYRWFAITLFGFAFLILGGIELYHIYQPDYQFNLARIGGRFLISLAFIAPAFYLIGESGKHRKNEDNYKDKELVLRTIDPYLSLIDSTKRDDLKIKIAEKVFVNSSSDNFEKGDAGNLITQLTNLIKQLRAYFKSSKG